MHESQLAPPGAGLPLTELVIARMLFRLLRLTGNRESFNTSFIRERAAIRHLLDSSDPESLARRVLIRRLRGLEDSSRYWSVWMTLDHLRIVNSQISQVLTALAHGVIPDRKASTAAVKPDPEVTADVMETYETSCDTLLETVAAIPDLKTANRYAHPWFGPLDASGWHALTGTHMGIHRVQIEQILQGSGHRGLAVGR